MSLLTFVKDNAYLSIIESIYQRWHFQEVSLLANTYNGRLDDDAFKKRYLLPFLTCKKCH